MAVTTLNNNAVPLPIAGDVFRDILAPLLDNKSFLELSKVNRAAYAGMRADSVMLERVVSTDLVMRQAPDTAPVAQQIPAVAAVPGRALQVLLSSIYRRDCRVCGSTVPFETAAPPREFDGYLPIRVCQLCREIISFQPLNSRRGVRPNDVRVASHDLDIAGTFFRQFEYLTLVASKSLPPQWQPRTKLFWADRILVSDVTAAVGAPMAVAAAAAVKSQYRRKLKERDEECSRIERKRRFKMNAVRFGREVQKIIAAGAARANIEAAVADSNAPAAHNYLPSHCLQVLLETYVNNSIGTVLDDWEDTMTALGELGQRFPHRSTAELLEGIPIDVMGREVVAVPAVVAATKQRIDRIAECPYVAVTARCAVCYSTKRRMPVQRLLGPLLKHFRVEHPLETRYLLMEVKIKDPCSAAAAAD